MIFIHIHPYFNLEDSAYLAALIDISLLFAEVFGHLERVRPKKYCSKLTLISPSMMLSRDDDA